MALLKRKENIPFWPHDDGGAFFVIKGSINIYHSEISPDGQALGPRRFLFQMQEGELYLPLPPHRRADGSTIALLAIPVGENQLNSTKPRLSPAMRPYVQEFVEQCARRMGYLREQTEAAYDELEQCGIDTYLATLIRLLDEHIEMEAKELRYRNRRRYAGEAAYLSGAVAALKAVIPGRKTKTDALLETSAETDKLIAVCTAVAKAGGMEIHVPRAMREGKMGKDAVEAIAAASRFRTREVILTDKWYKQDGGSLVGRRKDGDEPVALIQKSPRSYILFDPATGEKTKITAKVAEGLEPKALMFYKSLPMHSLSGKEVLRFVLSGTGKADWIWVFMMGLFGGLLGMLFPEISGRVFDTVIPDGDRNMLIQIGFLLGAVSLSTFTFELTRGFAAQRISGAAERDLQSAVWDRLLSLPVGFFKKYSAGELSGKAMSISQIQQTISGVVTNTVISSIFSIFYIFVMFSKSARLGLIGLLIVIVTLLISLAFGYFQLKHEKEQLQIDNKLSGRMFGWLSGLSKIKMSGSEKRTFYNWAQLFKESRAITYRKESIGNYSAVFNSVISLLALIFLYMAMGAAGSEKIGIGAFIAFSAAFGSLMQSFIALSGAIMSANVIGPLYEEAKPIFEAVPEYDEQKSEAPALSGDIELSRIHFSYATEGPLVIKDVSLHIRSGEHVALVGPSGSGKSTLFRILLAFEQPDSGEIYFDGMSLSQMDIRSVRRQLGVVLQSGQLFAGSIFENIAGANPNITMDDAMQAVKEAGMEEDLQQMPMGLHTMVSEGMGTLSGGQRQRLMIARALAGKPRILFFDEATSALDNKTQKIVSDSINQLKATRITIAHRLSTIQECDRIIVLEGGVITEQGSYDKLMRLGGTFAAMAARQLA